MSGPICTCEWPGYEECPRHPPPAGTVEPVEAVLRRYGVAERDIGAGCHDLSPHLRPPGSPRGRPEPVEGFRPSATTAAL